MDVEPESDSEAPRPTIKYFVPERAEDVRRAVVEMCKRVAALPGAAAPLDRTNARSRARRASCPQRRPPPWQPHPLT